MNWLKQLSSVLNRLKKDRLRLMHSIKAIIAIFFIFWGTITQAEVIPQKSNMSLDMGAIEEPCFKIKGSATSKGVAKEFAKKMAIRDALQQASMKNNLTVKMDQSVENYQLKLNSTRFTSASKVKNFKVIAEGFEASEDMYGQEKKGPLNYEVVLHVCLTEDRGVCTNLPGNQYQTRLAVAPVIIEHPQHANDVSHLLSGYQTEIERRIRNQGYMNYSALNDVVDVQPNIKVSPNLDSEALQSYRDKTGAQYLLMTAIRSMSSHNAKSGLSGIKNDIKSFYNLNVSANSRYIEADWYIVDLLGKKVVHQARGGFDVEGDVYVGRDKPFGTSSFFNTQTGKAFHALLEKQVTDTLDFLHCKSFQSEIIDVRDGEYVIYLNENSGAKVGDDLAVYHKSGRPVRLGNIHLGDDFLPGAFLKIKRIMPRFAIAEVTAKKGTIQVGDRVKTW